MLLSTSKCIWSMTYLNKISAGAVIAESRSSLMHEYHLLTWKYSYSRPSTHKRMLQCLMTQEQMASSIFTSSHLIIICVWNLAIIYAGRIISFLVGICLRWLESDFHHHLQFQRVTIIITVLCNSCEWHSLWLDFETHYLLLSPSTDRLWKREHSD